MFPFTVVAAMIVLPFALGVKPAHAADDTMTLNLDPSFIGHSVHFDLFGDMASLSWKDGVLIAATTLTVTRGTDANGGPTMHIEFSNPSAFASGSVADVSLGPTTLAQGSIRVSDGGTDQNFFAKNISGSMTGSISLSANMDVSLSSDVVSDPNIDDTTPTSVGAIPVSETGDAVTLTLDSGFVGRAVSLDLFDGAVTVAWDAKTLIAPTTIRVVRISGGVSSDDRAAGNGVRFAFEDAKAISQTGTMTVRTLASTPPENNEHASVKLNGTTTTAAFKKDSVVSSFSATASADVVPVYQTGIMHTGMATWYRYKNCLCAASPDVPKGTKLKVSRQDDPSRSVIITVNDYGPDRSIFPDRVIDLDRVAFAKIGNPRGGTLAVNVERIDLE